MVNYCLEAINITKKFPGVIANKDVNLKISKGEIHGLIGENGAGKSTLLKVLNGVYPYHSYEGEIKVNGEKVEFHSPHDAQLKGIGFVPQEINVLENLTVGENIFVGNWKIDKPNRFGISFKEIYQTTASFLQENKICLDPKMKVSLLSVGQRQLLMVARALSKSPMVLILDEPTTSLTMDEIDNLFSILKGLKAKGTSIIFVTHKLAEIMEITDSVTILRDGNNINTYHREDYHKENIITDMVGRKITNMYPKRNSQIGAEILKVENITVDHPRIKNRNILENVSFSLKKGEVLGLAGLIGSGRTELLCTLYGVNGFKTGSVVKNSKKLQIRNVNDAIKNGFSMVTEDRKKSGLLFLTHIKNNLTINNLKRVSWFGMIKSKIEAAITKKYFKMMRIKAPDIHTGVITLSGGNQQKVVIGRALNTDPEIILLDEPTKGVDIGSKNEIYHIINELVAQGTSIIMVSSELPELMEMCDRFLVMANGTIVGEFGKDEVSEKKIMELATKSKRFATTEC